MNIAYLSGTAIPSRAASALHVVKMAAALLAEGHAVSIHAVENPAEAAPINQFYELPRELAIRLYPASRFGRGGGYLFAARSTIDSATRRADAYYGRHPHALLAASYFGKPFAYEAHALPATRHALAIETRLLKRRNLKGLVCISQALADDYRELLPFDVPITVLADAADPAPCHTAARQPWPGRPGAPQIGYVGHLYPGKGMEVILPLAELLQAFDFHVVGGRESDIDHWRAQAPSNNLHLHGFVRNGELPGYYAHFDVALLPIQNRVSIADGRAEIGRWTSPLKAFEYMSHGLAVVASDTPVLREIFTDEQTAIMVAPDDVNAWADAVQRLAMHPDVRRGLGQRAKQRFLESHTWRHRARAIVELLAA